MSNMLAIDRMDTSDAAAYELLARIATSATEPLSDAADPSKTLGECRRELHALLFEAVQFVATRNQQR